LTHVHQNSHDHSHGHAAHGHSHEAPQNFNRAFAIGVGLNVVYVILEAGFGYVSGSLALLADAGHNLSDVLGLLLAWGAIWLAAKPPTGNRTYGFKRTPILASLANALILLVAVGAIATEAIRRLFEPEHVASTTVLWVAIAGVFVNGITAWLFMSGSKRDLNIRGAFLHMAADTGVTLGVIAAALLIRWTNWQWLDPAVSLLIAVVILIGSWGLLRDSVMLVMDAVPPGIDLDAVRAHLSAAEGVDDIHDLHIWGLSTTDVALSVHLVCANHEQAQRLLTELPGELHDHFGIGHSTLQIETELVAGNCRLRPVHVV
jgi:cobalt-zinc-cadmium efflux system protein